VLWCCWLGGTKGIWPVKNWLVWCWHGILLEWGADLHITQLLALPLTISALVNPHWFHQNGSAFLVPAYPGCPGKKMPLNECSSSSSTVCLCTTIRACLDQHLIAIRSREVLGDHVRSIIWVIAWSRPSAAVQTRPTPTVLQPILWLATLQRQHYCWCQQLLLTPWYCIRRAEGRDGVGVASCCSCSSMSGRRCLVWRGGMGHGPDGCTDNWWRPVVNDCIMLHGGDDVRCVYGHLVTNR